MYVTVVSLKDPHDYQVIEMFRKVGEKVLQGFEGENRAEQLCYKLNFVENHPQPKKLVI